MKKTIDQLKQSPLFNLSLSSKELFHSNFLYWIGTNYPKAFGEMFNPFLNEKSSPSKLETIQREKQNIDLTLKYEGGQQILIENKIKSIPYIEQLRRYSKNHNSLKSYILLSLSKPMFFENEETLNIDGAKWHYINYSTVKKLLEKLLENVENNYHREIISDYQSFIVGLVEINALTKIKPGDLFNFHSTLDDKIYKSLIDLRLHDFYLKKKYELLSYSVYKQLNEKGKNLFKFSQPLNWSEQSPIIFLGYGMTRSQGLMDLKYLISENIALGIQIQGEHYRMIVEDNNGTIARNIKEKLSESIWFDFSSTFPNERVYPKEEKGFNKYGSVFYYKSIKLGSNRTVDSLVEKIIFDVERIEKNEERIKEIVREGKGESYSS